MRGLGVARRRRFTARTATDGAIAGATPLSVLRLRIAALLAAQLFDFGTFTTMVARHGIAAELNPLVASGFEAYGLPLLAVTKAALILLVASILALLGRDWAATPTIQRVATVVALIAVASGMLGGISNVLVH